MKKYLNNPYLVGAISGLVAAIAHYANNKFVKKKEEIDYNECIKIFLLIALLTGGGMVIYQKKGNLLKGSVNQSVNTSSVQSGGGSFNSNINSSTQSSVPNNVQIGNNNLEISDINDVIHTGLPEF